MSTPSTTRSTPKRRRLPVDPAEGVMESTPWKRSRVAWQQPSPQQQQQQVQHIQNCLQQVRLQRSSAFGAPQLNLDRVLEQVRPRHKRPRESPCGPDGEEMFSASEVKKMLALALETCQTELRQQYDQTLQDKLCEQFNMFTQFNQDYVSRQIRKSEFSYLS